MRKLLLLSATILTAVVARSATFTSVATGNWSTPSTWSIVGSDPDGIPDNNDAVTISSGHTVTLTATGICLSLTINSSGTLNLNSKTLNDYGSLTNNGTVTTVGGLQFYGNGSLSGNAVTLTSGAVTFYSDYTIASGMTLTVNTSIINVSAYCVLTNSGTVIAGANPTACIRIFTGASWINAAGSSLSITSTINNAGTLDFSAAGNTVIYRNNTATSIIATTYHNLTLTATSGNTKTLAGNITVRGNLTIGTNVTLNWANFQITLFGNWVNNANTTCTNMGALNCSSNSTQTITRAVANAELLNILNMNGFGTLQLNDTIRTSGSVSINAGTIDVMANNFSIHCRGTFTNNGALNARQGTFFMDGTTAQSIDGTTNTQFYNLTISNSAGVTVNSNQSITHNLSVQKGAFGPNAFGTFTLKATGTTACARIGPLGATGSLTGNTWRVQTWINGPATAYWQYLGSPVTGSTIADWDNDTRFYMSGVGGNDGNSCCPIFRSVRTYNQPTNTYTNITSTATALTPGLGFMVWMSDNMTNLTSPLVYDTRGLPNSNTVNKAVSCCGSGSGYNLVSNPYACPINYATVVSSSSATLNASFLILQENGTYATSPNGGTIAGGQGFMCVASTAGNITFTEACKSMVANPNVIRQPAGNCVRIKVGNDVNGLGEETTVQLDPMGDQSMDYQYDLPYLASPYENATHIWTQNDNGDQFILNNIGTGVEHLMIPVNVITTTPGRQTLTFKDLNTVTAYNCAWLEDVTTGARINLNETDTYSFDEPEMGSTRNFILHFERTNNCGFDLTSAEVSLDAQTNVFVSGGQVFAGFEFSTEEPVTVSMYDLNGKMVMGETTMNVSTGTVALENPDAHGIYLVRFVKGNQVATKKFYY